MIQIPGHLLIFALMGMALLLAPLIIGAFIRPKLPTAEKKSVYECGEPAIGSSYIQFDLRFYVVALLFIVFDVEVVFFFPWVAVFGNVMQLTDTQLSDAQRLSGTESLLSLPAGQLDAAAALPAGAALTLGWTAFVDLLFFFAVLLVGFAYVWKRGDLDWVRALSQKVASGATARPTVRRPAPHTAVR